MRPVHSPLTVSHDTHQPTGTSANQLEVCSCIVW